MFNAAIKLSILCGISHMVIGGSLEYGGNKGKALLHEHLVCTAWKREAPPPVSGAYKT